MRQLALFLTVLLTINAFSQSRSWKYLEETPPGDIPKVFGLGTVSTLKSEQSSPVFRSDMKEMYWSATENPADKHNTTIYYCKYEHDMWLGPFVAKYSGKHEDGGITIHKDNIYFNSNRDIQHVSDSLKLVMHWAQIPDSRIWTSSYQSNAWSTPKLSNLKFDGFGKIFQLSFANNGNVYFTSHLGGVNEQVGIYKATKNGSGYSRPKPLAMSSVNSRSMDWTPFIAPDESYIIFSSTRNENREDQGDLYICFKTASGGWSKAMYMGDDINTWAQEGCPSVSPDGKYLFFLRWTKDNAHDIFWVSTNIIKKLKAQVQ
ncbi:MAG: hypothetical protein MI922_03695 [Bacteroidales bacterium]|nr:hypothetical protein [Bacteroidales bacterium]